MIAKDKVKAQMRKRKLKRFTDLAEEMGVSKQTLSAWFAGGPFSSPNLSRLIEVLNCTPNDVLVWDHPARQERAGSLLSVKNQRELAELAESTGQDINELVASFLRNERRRLTLLGQAKAYRGEATKSNS